LTGFFTRGFRGKRRPSEPGRVPPGQYETHDFPVLSAGPTPRVSLAQWDFRLAGSLDRERRWTWDEFRALPREKITRDIHCVTKWSKLDTQWEGVSVDTLLAGVESQARHVVAFCDGGYTTNLPLADVTGGKSWIVDTYDGQPLPPEHGGPARLLVPHLYFWKSAKWVRGLRLVDEDVPGFWEALGYHNYGDPWQEQRYSND
jgi:DMSO/TMAO reductase YedYZ molybdopterin-dependent catalytic subunit